MNSHSEKNDELTSVPHLELIDSGIPREVDISFGPTKIPSMPSTSRILGKLFKAGKLSIPIRHTLLLLRSAR